MAAGLAGCGMAGTSARPVAAHASHAASGGVRVQPDAVGWTGMVQRPDRIYVGMGGAPVVSQLTWHRWGGRQAWATGKLAIYRPQQGPVSGWHPTIYAVTVRLQDIAAHNGQLSYRKMTDVYTSRGGVTKVLTFTFGVRPGGSVPGWNPVQRKHAQGSPSLT
jgi:hypothetical protein